MNNKPLYQACSQIGRHPELRPFLERLKEDLNAAKDNLITAPEHLIPKLQGKCTYIKELIEMIEKSPEYIKVALYK